MRFELEGVVVRYPGARGPALAGADLRVESGSFHAVLGPNGSGKSTLMRALLGSAPHQQGRIELDGRALSAWPRRELARRVGGVPQSEKMPFPISVTQLVEMGRYPWLGSFAPMAEADRKAVTSALALCEVEHLASRDVQTLSGGELQRVRIARALAQEPEALVLDEPTASLDIRHEMAIFELLRTAADDGHTVLLITHHLELAARYADRVTLLDCGMAVAEGTPGEVLRPEILESVYRWPVQVSVDEQTGAPRIVPLSAPARDPSRPRL
jgi:iron complex transport system ATP-binding protein